MKLRLRAVGCSGHSNKMDMLLCQELMHAIYNEVQLCNQSMRFEYPMDTTCAYFGRRYCSSCLNSWGDIDQLLDLRTRRTSTGICTTGQDRCDTYRKLRASGILKSKPCCASMLFPMQHNITNSTAHAILAVSSSFDQPLLSALSIRATRQRLRTNIYQSSETPIPFEGTVTVDQVEKVLDD